MQWIYYFLIHFFFSFLAFISNVVCINGYKLHKQKFFGVLDNFFLFFNFAILYWFCHTPKWICHRHTCAPHPEPPSPHHPLRSSQSIMEFWDQKTWKLVVSINGSSYLCLLFDQEIKFLQEIREWGDGGWQWMLIPSTVSLQGHLGWLYPSSFYSHPRILSCNSLTLTSRSNPNLLLCSDNGFDVTIPRSWPYIPLSRCFPIPCVN